ncbi:hypothetical protein DJ79_03020 [Halorubrum ezzemoulense]|uniref:Uncharacterized protein n=1 Tax=Halorubrum ezzemoulense TaxID=337243 RepID=A0A256JA63_HALEZ|nr:hypothetical protein [Halorubrum ezzemoulense]OYR65640.1 hypothetical protein DJ80_01565 [Halorubrum ezzemoulense]OYR69347.1 hypothetical protein DJ79_03020 [Halorubrum ezzemoulense]
MYVSIGLVGDQRYQLGDSRTTEDQPAPDDREEGVNDLALESFAHAFAEAHADGEAGNHEDRCGGRRRGEADVQEGPSAPATAVTSTTVSTGPAAGPRGIHSTRVEVEY